MDTLRELQSDRYRIVRMRREFDDLVWEIDSIRRNRNTIDITRSLDRVKKIREEIDRLDSEAAKIQRKHFG